MKIIRSILFGLAVVLFFASLYLANFAESFNEIWGKYLHSSIWIVLGLIGLMEMFMERRLKLLLTGLLLVVIGIMDLVTK